MIFRKFKISESSAVSAKKTSNYYFLKVEYKLINKNLQVKNQTKLNKSKKIKVQTVGEKWIIFKSKWDIFQMLQNLIQ